MNKNQPNSHLKVDTKSNTSISSEAWQSHLPFFYLLQGGCGPALFWLVGDRNTVSQIWDLLEAGNTNNKNILSSKGCQN